MGRYTMGIDPGLTGGIVLLDEKGALVSLTDMPVIANGLESFVKNQINAAQLANIIRTGGERIGGNAMDPAWLDHRDVTAYVELVGAMPKQGVASMFSLGKSVGIIEGVLGALGIPLVLVRPQVWRNTVGLKIVKKAKGKGKTVKVPKGADKEQNRALAVRLYPDAADRLARKKDHGRADALLIATHGFLVRPLPQEETHA